MRIILITQNDPFYIAKNIKYLNSILPKHSQIICALISNSNPFGRNEKFFKKIFKTITIFGFNFFLNYSISYIKNLFNKSSNIKKTLCDLNIKYINLRSSINNPDNLKLINKENPDIFISILGNEIFKKELIELAPKGILNLHTSLLPKYRGLMPTFWVLRNREKYTGVSLFFVDRGIDSGPIVLQKKIKIGNMTQKELIKKTKKIGMELIAKAIDSIHKGDIKLFENKDEISSYYSFPTRNDVKVFLNNGKRFF